MPARALIVTPSNPLADAYASVLLAQRLYPGADGWIPGMLAGSAAVLHGGGSGWLPAVGAAPAGVDAAAVGRLVVVADGSRSLDGALSAALADAGVEKVLIARAVDPVPAWADPELVLASPDGAVAATLASILAGRGEALTPFEATAVAVAIHRATGSLTAPSTTDRDADVLAWCLRSGADRALVARLAALPDDAGRISIAGELRAIERAQPVLAAVEAAAAAAGVTVYVVGGTVRDILLGAPGFDLDLSVEGDAIALAETVAAALGGTATPHGAFGTAVVEWGSGERLDLVTARSETYPEPAALPVVTPGTIADDLARRDFTVNAIAAPVTGTAFGLLVDPYDGQADLAARTVRVLHDESFRDDPTRLFRAARYAARYGFGLDPHTERLAREAVAAGGVQLLSGARLREEVVAVLCDRRPAAAVVVLGGLGALSAIDPAVAADAETATVVERGLALAAELAPELPGWRVALAILARRLDGPGAAALAARLDLARRDAAALTGAVDGAPRLARAVRDASLRPSAVVAAADAHPLDAAVVALALQGSTSLRAYLADWRHRELGIDGADLAALGLAESPRVGEVLAELKRRALDGELAGRDAVLAAARQLVALGTVEL